MQDYATRTNVTPTEQTTQAQTGAQGLNGWQGGYFWQNGIPVMSIYDLQQQGQGFDFSQIFQPGSDRNLRIQGNLLNLARNPEAMRQFGEALTKFQPDNVHLSKATARVNPFGAKAVLKWDYNDGEGPTFKERFKNMFGRGNETTPIQGTEGITRMTPKPAFSGYETPQMPTENGSVRQAISDVNIDINDTSTWPRMSGGNPKYTSEEMMYGGIPKAKAGKIIIKQQFRPYGSEIAQSYSPFADAVSSALEMQGLQEQENMAYLPDFYMPSVPMSAGSRGNWGTGPLTGEQMPYLQPGNIGDSFYQNEPVFGTAASLGYQEYERAYGGNIYQDGGHGSRNLS